MTKISPKQKVKVPSYAALGLSLGLGVLAYFNQQTFGLAAPWDTLVTAGIVAGAALGISPATHGALATALKLPYGAALTLASFASTAAVGLATVSMDATVRSVLVGVLTTVAGALGGTALPKPEPIKRRRPAPVLKPKSK